MGLRPRQHAEKIESLQSLEERREYLETQVPPEFREWVKFYVIQAWERKSRASTS